MRLTFSYLAVRTYFGGESRVGMYHCAMYHGSAERPGAAYPLLEYALGDELVHPLHVTHNAFNMPSAFCPCLNLVVSDEVRQRLQCLPNVSFLPVKFVKLFSIPYAKDRKHYPLVKDSDVFLKKQEHDPRLEGTLPPYHEVIVASLDQVNQGERAFHFRFTPPWGNPIEVNLSTKLLDQYPIMWHNGFLLKSTAMGILKPFLDSDFFQIMDVEVELPNRSAYPT